MKSVMQIQDVSLAYDKQIIARDINFSVEEGEIVCIVGKSGCGKTTLFHALAGLSHVAKGDILLRGKSISGVAGEVSYMLQKDLLLPNKRVVDNVALPYILAREKLEHARQKAFELLVEFGLDEYANSWPYELSGGMKQRVALLRTYASGKDVILLDEAFSALDAITRMEVRNWFIEAARMSSKTIIAITHDIDEAAVMGDTIYVMVYSKEDGYSHLVGPIHNNRQNKDLDSYMLSDEFIDVKKTIMSKLGI